jgi:large subunit ribosomal protein L20
MHKDKILQLAKGFRGRANNCISLARNKVEKALQYAYRDRRNKKRDMRALWIQRINAGAKQHGVPYSRLMHGLAQENIRVNRKVLSELAMNEPHSFKALVDQVRLMRGGAVGTAPAPAQPVDSLAGSAAPRVSL